MCTYCISPVLIPMPMYVSPSCLGTRKSSARACLLILNDSLHKYSSTTKLEHRDSMKKWSLVNNECSSQQDIYGSNTLIHVLLMTRIPALRSYYFFHTTWHTLN